LNSLLLLTNGYPFGKGETFLETEIVFLAREFTTIQIIAIDCKSNLKRDLPSNVSVEKLLITNTTLFKLLSTKYIANKLFWKEILVIKKSYRKRISLSIIKTILISLARAYKINHKISAWIQNENEENELTLYSYWCDDSALAIALEKSKNQRTIGITRIHGWDVYFEASKINYLPFRQLIANQCDMIFAISKAGKKYAIDKWRINPNQIQLSHLGISNKYTIDFNRTNKTLHIVSCSNMIPLKRIHLIVEAFMILKDLKLKWTHFGNGPERIFIETLLKKLPKSIDTTLKGNVSNHEIYSFYKLESPQLFINVSSTEGIPVSIMEAMSFGLAVIATDVGGTSEIVTNQNGYLLEVNPTPEKVAETIESFYNLSTEKKNTKRKIAYKTWEEKYKAKRNYTQFTADILSL
jgi:glycosyltransferase involved in cell wall biosynthesis